MKASAEMNSFYRIERIKLISITNKGFERVIVSSKTKVLGEYKYPQEGLCQRPHDKTTHAAEEEVIEKVNDLKRKKCNFNPID